ncbi:MAG: prolyl oligopeptidase family serine peptidase [Cyclobacteriaceae bacterium]|nr:prolyl oligopeptidase family serine peptidase [Cyclobacteriaceae bacterium]
MNTKLLTSLFLVICLSGLNVKSQEHKWINYFPEENGDGLLHRTYYSNIHDTMIGYTIALPMNYFKKENSDTKYPVVYCLHGGNPGNESQILWYQHLVKPIIEDYSAPPMIYVWNNGGKYKSHYDFPQKDSYAESTFIKELIPHIDSTYRTIQNRIARGLMGYSMGGRAAARYIFKFPELFSISVAIAGGHQWEKENSITNGNNGEYQPTDNSWDLAKKYAKNQNPQIKLFVLVGSNDMNYEANISWTEYLRKLGIHHSITIVEGVKHREVDKLFNQLGLETLHYILYQNFKSTIKYH